jgi:EPS-associated MarR family transcriptional regulator
MTDRRNEFRDEVRFKILRMLEAHPESSQRDLASALGISLGGVNYCLKALVDKGLVKVANFRRSDNKLGYAYVLTPGGMAERALLTGRFLQRKIREYEVIRAEIEDLTKEFVGSEHALGKQAPHSEN